jgi:UDP-N-acetylmuramoylalanine-D-glutamate ligase
MAPMVTDAPDIRSVGVIGAGQMGNGIAHVCALAGLPVTIVDIKPEALEDNLICYLKTSVNVVLREKLTVAIETLMFKIPLFGLATITLSPTSNPPVPHNPAIEDDELKVFVTMTV